MGAKVVGAAVGDTVGDEVEAVGDALGAPVGDKVGETLGDTLGPADGDAVGATLGDTVGAIVGLNEGILVGANEGDKVGATVGVGVGSADLIHCSSPMAEKQWPLQGGVLGQGIDSLARRASHTYRARTPLWRVDVHFALLALLAGTYSYTHTTCALVLLV